MLGRAGISTCPRLAVKDFDTRGVSDGVSVAQETRAALQGVTGVEMKADYTVLNEDALVASG